MKIRMHEGLYRLSGRMISARIKQVRMITVEKCKWKYGKQAPVVIMMDDLCNKYMIPEDGASGFGNDWGGYCKKEYSWYRFVNDNIFNDFPYARMTCFLVTGRREDLIRGERANRNISLRIDETDEFRDFLTYLSSDEHFEVAYHGYTHGKCSDNGRADGFVQEWRAFKDLDEAVKTIRTGISLYHDVTGCGFSGGKFCGYATNEYSVESITRSGFEYWCCNENYADLNGGQDIGFIEDMVDFPSTVDGHLFSLRLVHHVFGKEYLRALYYLIRKHTTLEGRLKTLINNGQVISIQSHTSPIREDNMRQFPNVVDDIDNIRYILKFLKKYDLWYATCAEISSYYRSYMGVDVSSEGRQITVIPKMERCIDNIWIRIEGIDKDKKWILVGDNGERIGLEASDNGFLCSLPPQRSGYCIMEYSDSCNV